MSAHLINVALIGQLDHDLKLLHLDVQRIIVFAEEDLRHDKRSLESPVDQGSEATALNNDR